MLLNIKGFIEPFLFWVRQPLLGGSLLSCYWQETTWYIWVIFQSMLFREWTDFPEQIEIYGKQNGQKRYRWATPHSVQFVFFFSLLSLSSKTIHTQPFQLWLWILWRGGGSGHVLHCRVFALWVSSHPQKGDPISNLTAASTPGTTSFEVAWMLHLLEKHGLTGSRLFEHAQSGPRSQEGGQHNGKHHGGVT